MTKVKAKQNRLAERAKLAATVFEVIYEAFDTFAEDHVGADLAYLMGAILDSPEKKSYVDWSPEIIVDREVVILAVLRENFPPRSILWSYIHVEEKKECR
ncbi:hypothetical protein L0244_33915 [bacterium]|nr:hypothetical protein [bacterium]